MFIHLVMPPLEILECLNFPSVDVSTKFDPYQMILPFLRISKKGEYMVKISNHTLDSVVSHSRGICPQYP